MKKSKNSKTPKKSDPDQILIGTYELCHLNVDLYALTRESGGYLYTIPDKNRLPRIKIGLCHERWFECLEVLMHETFEFALLQYRYCQTWRFTSGHDGYSFHFTHDEFTEACGASAIFLAQCMPAMAQAYNLHRKKKK